MKKEYLAPFERLREMAKIMGLDWQSEEAVEAFLENECATTHKRRWRTAKEKRTIKLIICASWLDSYFPDAPPSARYE